MISAQGIQPEQQNINNIVDFNIPSNKDEVRAFLGMAGFYKRFVPTFAQKTQPLFDLLEKDKLILWNQECETGFNRIKECINNPRTLAT